METIEIKALRAGYYVDQFGNLLKFGQKVTPQIDTERNGYLKYHCSLFGERFGIKVHRLQAFIKFGDAIYKDGIQVRHLNGDSHDNSFSNIEIGTASQNQMDIPESIRKARAASKKKVLIGRKSIKGDCAYDVEKIVELKKKGYSLRQIKDEVGIKSVGHLSRIINKTAKYRGLL